MDIAKFLQYIGSGTAYTLAVTFIALPLGFIIGLIFSLLHIYGGKVLRPILTIYSTVMRGIPQIVLLFILYFIMSGTINLTPFWAGSISLGVVSSAYQMEIIRGAFLSVSGSQMMVARAVGLSKFQSIIHVILPQALRLVIPPWSNEAAIVIKDSSLVYALGVPEILRRAQLISASSQEPFLAYTTAAVIYFLLVFVTNRLLNALEKKLRIPANP